MVFFGDEIFCFVWSNSQKGPKSTFSTSSAAEENMYKSHIHVPENFFIYLRQNAINFGNNL